MKLFVFGLGYCARYFVCRFRKSFKTAAGTVRSAERMEELERLGIETFIWGPSRQDERIGGRAASADAVLVSVPPGDKGDPVLAQFGRALASRGGGQIIVYLSTIGVYGDRGGDWVDETALPAPSAERSLARLYAEDAWLALGRETGKTVHILRLAGIYGPGRNPLISLKAGTARRIVKPGQVFNRIHVEDVSRAIAAAFAYEGESGIFNVSDGCPAPPQDVTAFAAGLMGIEPPPEQDLDSAGLPPLARSFYSESRRVSNRKLKEMLGVTLAYPDYKAGIKALWEAGEGR
ncbi:MAG TPA: SDR family oxidoreductase [Methylocella sp.]|nr:SDR family oxidoreductase [Methylocella sp.]